jgi:hypothetical protein
MANKAYRSRSGTVGTPSPWSNTGGITWDVYSTTATGGVFPAGTWSQASVGDYPGHDDYVWLQSTYIVSYDPPAIAANNSSTFKQISARTDASGGLGGLIAQPTGSGGIGASNLTTGYVVFTTASTTVISANYFAPYTNTSANGMFYINVFNPSPNYFEFDGSLIQSNNGRFIVVASGLSSGNWIKYLGTLISGGSANSQAIQVNSASKIDVTGDVTSGNEFCIELGTTTGSIVNVTGNINGSNVNAARPAIVAANTTGTNTVNVAGDIQSGTLSPAINLGLSATPAANNVVNITSVNTYIKNYGLSGVTPTGTASAIVAVNITLDDTTTIQYKIGSNVRDFKYASSGTVPAAKYVLDGIAVGTGVGTLVLPSQANVQSQVVYGIGAQGQTYPPTGDAVSGTLDLAASVWGAATKQITSVAANGITSSSIQDGAITNAKVADDVDVNVKTISNNAITAASIASNAIDADALATDAVTEIATATSTQTISDLNTGSSADIAVRLRNVSTVATTGDQIATLDT